MSSENYLPSGSRVDFVRKYELRGTKKTEDTIKEKAAEMNLSEESFISLLLDRVTEDNLFDAVLDESEDYPEKKS